MRVEGCMSYEEEDACMSYAEEDECVWKDARAGEREH